MLIVEVSELSRDSCLVILQMKFHGQVLEGIYKDIPKRMLPVEYLPDDYTGPNAGTEKQLIGS